MRWSKPYRLQREGDERPREGSSNGNRCSLSAVIDQLQESRRNLSRQATAELKEKLKLHCLQKANVERVLLKLKNCHELVEEELRSRSQYQIQEAKGELVRLITETHSEVEVNKLQPAQEANITFIRTTGSGHVGMISSNQTTSFPGLFTVEIPSNVRVYEKTEVVLTAHLPLSARRLSRQPFRIFSD